MKSSRVGLRLPKRLQKFELVGIHVLLETFVGLG